MQIQFDPRDRDSCANVLAVIATMHGTEFVNDDIDALETSAGNAPAATATPPPVPAPVASPNGEPDAETAFGGNGTPAAAPSSTSDSAAVAAPASPPAPPPSGVELDADGLPWDARIHSGPEDTKPKNADGRWRAKRGMGDKADYVKEVEAELRQVMGATAPAPSPTPAAAEQTPPPPPPAADSPEPAPAEAPTPVPPAPAPTPPAADTGSGPAVATPADSPPPPAAPTGNPFAELMRKITARQTAGTLTVADTKTAAEALGLTGVADLLKRPDLIEAFEAALPGEAG